MTLTHLNFTKTCTGDTDASDFGIGKVFVFFLKYEQGRKRPVAYIINTFFKPERRNAVTRKKVLAVVKTLKPFRFYVLGRRFFVRT